VGWYTFISSVSVYGTFPRPGIDESAPPAPLSRETEEIDGATYGPLKALCEAAVEEVMEGRALNIRPGLIVGPWDPTDRFTYWVRRVSRGGRVLAPGDPGRQVQIIHARDLAGWTIALTEKRAAGVYNATGPEQPLTMGQLLDACQSVSGAGAEFAWAPDRFLLERDVAPWTDLPLWIPDGHEMSNIGRIDCSKAFAAGLAPRPVEETIADTLAWDRTRDQGAPLRAGLASAREDELLAALAAG
jgi:2'-hydroxyisoflavone reductase